MIDDGLIIPMPTNITIVETGTNFIKINWDCWIKHLRESDKENHNKLNDLKQENDNKNQKEMREEKEKEELLMNYNETKRRKYVNDSQPGGMYLLCFHLCVYVCVCVCVWQSKTI